METKVEKSVLQKIEPVLQVEEKIEPVVALVVDEFGNRIFVKESLVPEFKKKYLN